MTAEKPKIGQRGYGHWQPGGTPKIRPLCCKRIQGAGLPTTKEIPLKGIGIGFTPKGGKDYVHATSYTGNGRYSLAPVVPLTSRGGTRPIDHLTGHKIIDKGQNSGTSIERSRRTHSAQGRVDRVAQCLGGVEVLAEHCTKRSSSCRRVHSARGRSDEMAQCLGQKPVSEEYRSNAAMIEKA